MMEEQEIQPPERDTLDDKANQIFAGKVVRKDLVRKVKVGANVPVFVLEFLLGKFCASSDEMAIQMGLKVVNKTLAENYIGPDESERTNIFPQKLCAELIDITHRASIIVKNVITMYRSGLIKAKSVNMKILD